MKSIEQMSKAGEFSEFQAKISLMYKWTLPSLHESCWDSAHKILADSSSKSALVCDKRINQKRPQT